MVSNAVQRTRITRVPVGRVVRRTARRASRIGFGRVSRRPVIGQPRLIMGLAIARPTIAWQCGLAVQLANRPHIRQLVVYPHWQQPKEEKKKKKKQPLFRRHYAVTRSTHSIVSISTSFFSTRSLSAP